MAKGKLSHSLLFPLFKQESSLFQNFRQWFIVLKHRCGEIEQYIVLKHSCGEIYYEFFCCRKYIRKLFIIEQQFSPEEDRKNKPTQCKTIKVQRGQTKPSQWEIYQAKENLCFSQKMFLTGNNQMQSNLQAPTHITHICVLYVLGYRNVPAGLRK